MYNYVIIKYIVVYIDTAFQKKIIHFPLKKNHSVHRSTVQALIIIKMALLRWMTSHFKHTVTPT